ncbi:MAG: MFS transporter, partial [Solirubrobacterales bacterium]
LAVAVALALLTLVHDSAAQVLAAVILVGAGIGFVFAAMANVVVESVPPEQVGIATGLNTVTRTVGGAIGAQVATAIVAASESSATGLPAESGFETAFAVSTALALAALITAFAVPRASATGAPRLAPG